MFGKSKTGEPGQQQQEPMEQANPTGAAPAEGCINAQTVIKGEIQFQGVMHVEGHGVDHRAPTCTAWARLFIR